MVMSTPPSAIRYTSSGSMSVICFLPFSLTLHSFTVISYLHVRTWPRSRVLVLIYLFILQILGSLPLF
ncbi:hypothetical protein EDB19DRAFT_1747040 [Suillus lakei]|nr:hypothetical protein EDB19DRAFT_1747040 [Suillus lakei]